ncbi:MAG TPA: Fur family transcriptional regulator [Candidatus Saccharimonadales bacterium]|nr:Fur family transcriptional regulator [Candidatus Saccharimonadales bacterium]
MTTSVEKFEDLLKRNGFSITRQRLLIFDLLTGAEPISMNELIKYAGEKLDKVSVYRTVAAFEKIGIVQRLNTGWKYKIELTDKFNDHHHHLTCVKCHKIISINAHDLENFIEQVSKLNDFKPSEHQVEIQGFCKQCSQL